MSSKFRHSRCSWKNCTMLVILLCHAVFGTPVVPYDMQQSSFSLSDPVTSSISLPKENAVSLDEDVFGPSLDKRGSREKRLLFETLKKAKQAKLLSFGAASADAAKSIGKSIFKTVATLGLKAILFNFLYTKINQVLDFKNRLLNNLDQKNKEQNSQILASGDSSSDRSASTSISSSTENPAEEIPEYNPDKISLAVPDGLIKPSFDIVNGASQVVGTVIQNKATRLAKLFEALQPIFRSSAGFKSKKREAEVDNKKSNNSESSYSNIDSKTSATSKNTVEDTPIKTSYSALIEET